MKTLSLKLDDLVFEETEELLDKIKMPRNRYFNEAIQYYNSIQQKKFLKKQITLESKLVAEESMAILKEFEILEENEG